MRGGERRLNGRDRLLSGDKLLVGRFGGWNAFRHRLLERFEFGDRLVAPRLDGGGRCGDLGVVGQLRFRRLGGGHGLGNRFRDAFGSSERLLGIAERLGGFIAHLHRVRHLGLLLGKFGG